MWRFKREKQGGDAKKCLRKKILLCFLTLHSRSKRNDTHSCTKINGNYVRIIPYWHMLWLFDEISYKAAHERNKKLSFYKWWTSIAKEYSCHLTWVWNAFKTIADALFTPAYQQFASFELNLNIFLQFKRCADEIIICNCSGTVDVSVAHSIFIVCKHLNKCKSPIEKEL